MSDKIISLGSNISDYKKDDFADIFFIRYDKTMSLINSEIDKYAKNNEDEVARIKRIFYRNIVKVNKERGINNSYVEIIDDIYGKPFDDKESYALQEFMLSTALVACRTSKEALRERDLNEALNLLCDASEYLGLAMGYEQGEIFKGFDEEIKRKTIRNLAANNRHRENWEMRDSVIQYYKDNREALGKKDEAAFKLAEKFTPYAFSTIRDWIKNV